MGGFSQGFSHGLDKGSIFYSPSLRNGIGFVRMLKYVCGVLRVLGSGPRIRICDSGFCLDFRVSHQGATID